MLRETRNRLDELHQAVSELKRENRTLRKDLNKVSTLFIQGVELTLREALNHIVQEMGFEFTLEPAKPVLERLKLTRKKEDDGG